MSEQAAVTPTGIRGAVRRLYNWVLKWADTPYGRPALFFIALAEASFFPIPPDVLLIALVLGKPSWWLRTAAVCLAGSLIGAVGGYLIGWALWAGLSDFFFHYVFKEAVFQGVVHAYEENAFLVILTAAFTPIPFKAITIAAGVAKINVGTMLLASLLGRGGRFFLVAGLIGRFGDPMKKFIDKYFEALTLLFMVLLIGSFALLKVIFPSSH